MSLWTALLHLMFRVGPEYLTGRLFAAIFDAAFNDARWDLQHTMYVERLKEQELSVIPGEFR